MSGEKTICRTSMAINMSKDVVEYINITAFDKKAELIEKYFHKGDRIGIIGRIHNGSYTNKDGAKVYTSEIYVEDVEFLQDKKEAKPVDEFGIPTDVEDGDLPF